MRTRMDEVARHWRPAQPWVDPAVAGAVMLVTLGMYIATLLPDVGVGDVAEFQRAAPSLGLVHPTGYPLYLILGWAWSHLPLGGTPAWRMSLFSAAAAAAANGTLYVCGREMGQRRVIALAAALANATAITFWMQATIAEVYALAALLQAALFLALWRWRARRAPLVLVGALCGLALAHHRTAIFLLPGVALFIALTRRPSWREILAACLALCAGLLIYIYLPLRLPPELRTWPYVLAYISGRDLAAAGFDGARLWREGATRLLALAGRDILPQLMLVGSVLAVLGALRILLRDRASAALLLSVYLLMLLFSAAYYVYDTEVFMVPAHVVAALLFGEGAMLLLARLPPRQAGWLAPAALAVPLSLGLYHAPEVRATNLSAGATSARAIMAQPLTPGALFIVDWWHIYEALSYLQKVEEIRPDIQLMPADLGQVNHATIGQVLEQGRAVYLLRPIPNLEFGQVLDGLVWRVEREPVSHPIMTLARLDWTNGVALTGYTIEAQPYKPGEVVPITLAWQVQHPIERWMTVFIHLIGPDGEIWGQQDYAPVVLMGEASAGQQYSDLAGPMLSPQAPAGRYQVNIGWYDGTSLQRIALVGAGGLPAASDVVTLAEIEVQP